MTEKQFALYRHWLDSTGYEHRVKAKQGTIATLNSWARKAGLYFKRDSSLFGGYWLGPSGEWYTADIPSKRVAKKLVRRVAKRAVRR